MNLPHVVVNGDRNQWFVSHKYWADFIERVLTKGCKAHQPLHPGDQWRSHPILLV